MRFHRHLIIAISFALLSCASLTSCNKKKNSPTLPPPVRVKVEVASEKNVSAQRQYSGTVSSSDNTTVSFAVAGTITNLYVEEGQKVSKGQLIGKVRDGEYINALNIAEAQLAEAQDGYNRLKKLHDANALPDVKWVEMQQKLKQAQNAVEMAKRSVNDASLHSPVTGTVTRKLADVGQTVLPVQPIYEIVSTSDLTIDVSVSENEIGNFELGEKAKINFDSKNIPQIEGKVTSKAVAADPLTRSYQVKLSIGSEGGKILPGMIGTVEFENTGVSENDNQAIVLPTQAVLLNEDNRLFVWIVKNGMAERRFVEADELSGSGIIVKSGLQPTDSIIVAGMQKVGTGTKVIAIQ